MDWHRRLAELLDSHDWIAVEVDVCEHTSYHAVLVGYEGQIIHEYEVPPEPDGGPPLVQRMAFARPARHWQREDGTTPTFPVVEYQARERCRRGCCIWYHRVSPLWEA